ncbi:hypothetical protein B0H10DRAFT_1940581 [Mycena sp. CBHHK59/15]|nr:hypothetical protein B0H10DRAFT_1940581 [Mycena sp. CBHHK59/15]
MPAMLGIYLSIAPPPPPPGHFQELFLLQHPPSRLRLLSGPRFTVTGNNFNRKMIVNLNSVFWNPDIEYSGKPLITLGAAVEDTIDLHLAHSCFGQRILYGLPHSGQSWDLIAFPAQPTWVHERTPSAMVASGSNVCGRSPTISVDPTFIEVLFSDDDELPPVPLLLCQANPQHAAAALSWNPEIHFGTGPDIALWQQTIATDVRSVAESQTVKIHGTNITEIAKFIIDVFVHLPLKQLGPSSSTMFPKPVGIRNPRTGMTHQSFLQHTVYRDYQVPSSGFAVAGGPTSIGHGIEKAVFRTILRLISGDYHSWRPSPIESSYVTFILSRLTVGFRIKMFTSKSCFLVNLFSDKFLQLSLPSLSPGSPIQPADPIPMGTFNPVCSLIVDLLDVQPHMISSPHDRDGHDKWTVPWNHPEFLALSAGFNMPLSNLSNGRTFNHQFQEWAPLKVACLIASMYHRQVKSINEILSHLQYDVVLPPLANSELSLMCTLFKLHFKRYLRDKGHPQWFRTHGMIDNDEELQCGLENPFLHAHLLLLTALESSLLLIQHMWYIKFTVSSLLPPRMATGAMVMNEVSPLQFHTCSGGVDVHVNPKLYDLMIQSAVGDKDTEFDVWVHTQLYNTDLAYTRL